MDLDHSRSNFFFITIDLFFLLTELVGMLFLYSKLLHPKIQQILLLISVFVPKEEGI